MEKSKNASGSEIKKFIQESLKEIRDALPEKFRIDDKIHFEISVVTASKAKGGLDIKIASVGSDVASQNIHKIRFSIVDEEAQAKAWKIGKSILMNVFSEIAELDKINQIEFKDLKKNKKKR